MIQHLSIDLETRSSADIGKSGVYRYAESEDFDILLFGVSVNHGPVQVFDFVSGEQVPEEILQALVNPAVVKSAYNASFERVCLSRWLRRRSQSGSSCNSGIAMCARSARIFTASIKGARSISITNLIASPVALQPKQ